MGVDILGTEYKIFVDTGTLEKKNLDGECGLYTKEIAIRKTDNFLSPEDTKETKEKREHEVLRHEIIHAFFFEAGLHDLASNELLVDWLAIQFPKMAKAFKEVGCL